MEFAGKLLYIFKRLREPSTHAALAGICQAFGQAFPEAKFQAVMNGLTILFGMIGVFVAEAKPATHVDGF